MVIHTHKFLRQTNRKKAAKIPIKLKKHQNILRWFLPYQKGLFFALKKVFSGPDFQNPSPTYGFFVSNFLK